MITHDYKKATIANDDGEVLFNVIYRDGKFDFVPTDQLHSVPVTTFRNRKAGEYWCLAMAMENDAATDH